ncbi:aspartate-semialdehyde dehydrogenase [Pantoea allii]|uniref:aspartate-semialdehyde dehydrogenase n=1 Tax=Pantoea allii TaxID=574096 RepID=UPI003D7A7D81
MNTINICNNESSSGYNLAIVGATGAVGKELIHCLEHAAFKVKNIRLFASKKSANKKIKFKNELITIEEITINSFKGIDILFFASSNDVTELYYEQALKDGVRIIDNSSFFRLMTDIPLIVPEVNGDIINKESKIIANPNCVVAILSLVLHPLHKRIPIKKISISTYQAASGAGEEAMSELIESSSAYIENKIFIPNVFKFNYAFNLFSHDSKVDATTGYNSEELKIIEEIRKIFSKPQLLIGVTCVRVPVLRAHTMVANIEFESEFEECSAREILTNTTGVKVIDDRLNNYFPMPSDASHNENVLVGRIRKDISDPSQKTLSLMISGDQLLKGAALNAVQIASLLLLLMNK